MILLFLALLSHPALNSLCWFTCVGNDAGIYTLYQNLMRIPRPGYFIPQ